MEDKNQKDLLNYVKNYNIPKKEPKYEDRHIVVPLPTKKRKKNDNKETKKKSSKLKRVNEQKENNLYKKDPKKEPNKNIGKKSKEINYDELIKTMEKRNNYLNEQIKRRENNIAKYQKKYQDQQNIIKSLELILSEQKEQKNSKNNSNKDKDKNKNINDIDYVNDILANDIESLELDNMDNLGDEDILYDENFQEDFAIKAVDQQIIDDLYPNPDAMSYEQLLQLEDNMGSVNKGLTKNQFEKLPEVKYDKDKYSENYQCIICMEEFKIKEKVKLLPCGHIFHKNCIKEWLLKQKSCPFCKSEIG